MTFDPEAYERDVAYAERRAADPRVDFEERLRLRHVLDQLEAGVRRLKTKVKETP